MRRAVKRIDTHPQGNRFGPGGLVPVAEVKPAAAGPVVFNRPDPRGIFLGPVRLDAHLRVLGTSAALRTRRRGRCSGGCSTASAKG